MTKSCIDICIRATGADKAEKALKDTGDAAEKMGKKGKKSGKDFDFLKGAIGGLTAIAGHQAVVAVRDFTAEIITLGSDAAETASLIESSLGGATESFNAQLEDLADRTNRSFFELQEGTATVIAMTRAMGLGQQQAADYGVDVASLAADFSSFFNVTDEQFFEDFQAALAGSSETLQKYGINAKVSAVNQEAVNLGLVEAGEALDDATRAQALYSIVVRQGADAIGDAERTSGGYANQVRKLQSEFTDLKVSLGQELVPALLPLVTNMASLAEDVGPGVVQAFSDIITLGANAALVLGDMREQTSGIMDDLATATGGNRDASVAFAIDVATFGAYSEAIRLMDELRNRAEELREEERLLEIATSDVTTSFDHFARTEIDRVIIDTAESAFEATTRFHQFEEAATGAALGMGDYRSGLIEAQEPIEAVHLQVNRFGEELRGINRNFHATVTVGGIDSALEEIGNVNRQLAILRGRGSQEAFYDPTIGTINFVNEGSGSSQAELNQFERNTTPEEDAAARGLR